VTSAAASLWREWLGAALDLVFPPFCVICRHRLGAGRRDPLCGPCWVALERIGPPMCARCGRPFPRLDVAAVAPAQRCGDCRRRPPAFTAARAAARYGDTVREALHAFKFDRRRALAAPLGDLLAEIPLGALATGGIDVVVPVPLHPSRERERGFNQAALLARRAARVWGLPLAADALGRAVPTATQTALAGRERQDNVRGAFTVRRPEAVAGRRVGLVDDVLTTGATAGECARCLHDAGAAAVVVLTVARAV
jgi:ComF family protein